MHLADVTAVRALPTNELNAPLFAGPTTIVVRGFDAQSAVK